MPPTPGGSSKISSKSSKRLSDIKSRLQSNSIRIVREALQRLPQIVQTEVASSGLSISHTARDLILAIAGLNKVDQSDFTKNVNPRESLAPFALDIYEIIYTQQSSLESLPNCLESLCLIIASQQQRTENDENFSVYPSVIEWIARRSAFGVIQKKFRLQNDDRDIKGFAFSSLVTSFVDLKINNQTFNIINCFACSILDLLDEMNNKPDVKIMYTIAKTAMQIILAHVFLQDSGGIAVTITLRVLRSAFLTPERLTDDDIIDDSWELFITCLSAISDANNTHEKRGWPDPILAWLVESTLCRFFKAVCSKLLRLIRLLWETELARLSDIKRSSIIISWIMWISAEDNAIILECLRLIRILAESTSEDQEECLSQTDRLTVLHCLVLPLYVLSSSAHDRLQAHIKLEITRISTFITQIINSISHQYDSPPEGEHPSIMFSNHKCLAPDRIWNILSVVTQGIVQPTAGSSAHSQTALKCCFQHLNAESIPSSLDYQSFLLAYLMCVFVTPQAKIVLTAINLASKYGKDSFSEPNNGSSQFCDLCRNQGGLSLAFLCQIKLSTIVCFIELIELRQPIWGDVFIPLLLGLIMPILDSKSDKNSNEYNVCPRIQSLALRAIASLGGEKFLVPIIYKVFQLFLPIELFTTALSSDLTVPQLCSLSIGLSALRTLALSSKLGMSKLLPYLTYRIDDPVHIRRMRLQLFNDIAEDMPSDAIQSLKEIQSGLKDDDVHVRGLALCCLNRFCCQDVMDFTKVRQKKINISKVWSILGSKHYSAIILRPATQTPEFFIYLIRFLREFVTRVIVNEIFQFKTKSNLTFTELLQNPIIARAFAIGELCLEAVDALLLNNKITDFVVNIACQFLEILGVLMEQCIGIARSYSMSNYEGLMTSHLALHLPLSNKYHSSAYLKKNQHLSSLLPSSSSPSFSWSSALCAVRFVICILGLQRLSPSPKKTEEDGFDFSLEDGCCKLIYYALKPFREDIGRQKLDNSERYGPQPAAYSCLLKALRPYVAPGTGDFCVPATRAALAFILGPRKYAGPWNIKTEDPVEGQKLEYLITVIIEVVMDIRTPSAQFCDLLLVPQQWSAFFLRTLGHTSPTSGQLCSPGAPVCMLVTQALLSLLHLDPEQKQPLETIMASAPDFEGISSDQITSSGSSEAFANVLFAATAIACLPSAPVSLAAAVFEFLNRLLESSLRQTPAQSQESSYGVARSDRNNADVWDISIRIAIVAFVNMVKLQQRVPSTDFMSHCILFCGTVDSIDVKRSSISFASTYNSSPTIIRAESVTYRPSQLDLNEVHATAIEGLVGLSVYGISTVVEREIHLALPGLSFQVAVLEALASELKSSTVAAAQIAAIGVCQTLAVIHRNLASEENLDAIEFLMNALVSKMSEIQPRESASLALPIAVCTFVLASHSRALHAQHFKSIVALFRRCTASHLRGSAALVCQSIMFLTSAVAAVSTWNYSSSSEELEITTGLRELKSDLKVLLQLPSRLRTEKPSNWDTKYTENLQQISYGIWDSFMLDEIWDKQLSLLILNSIQIFSISTLCQENSDCGTSSSDPFHLKTILEALGIMSPDSVIGYSEKTSGSLTSQRQRLQFDLRSLVTDVSRLTSQNFCLVTLIFNNLATPVKTNKIIMPPATQGAISGNPLVLLLNVVQELSNRRFHYQQILFDLRSSLLIFSSEERTIEITQRLKDVIHMISVLSMIWRSIEMIDLNQDINLSPTVSNYFLLVYDILNVIEPTRSMNKMKIENSEEWRMKSSLLFELRAVTMQLLLNLLSLCSTYASVEESLAQLLTQNICKIILSVTSSSSKEEKRKNNPSILSYRPVLFTSLIYRSIILMPALVYTITYNQCISLHSLFINNIPLTNEFVWMFYIQQLCRACRGVTRFLMLKRTRISYISKRPEQIQPEIFNKDVKHLINMNQTESFHLLKTFRDLIYCLIVDWISTKIFNSKKNISCMIQISFAELLENYLRLIYCLDDNESQDLLKSFNEFIPRVSARIVGYLIAKNLLPLSALDKHRERLIKWEGDILERTEYQAEFSSAVKLLNDENKLKIVAILLRSSTLPIVNKKALIDLLSLIFEKILLPHIIYEDCMDNQFGKKKKNLSPMGQNNNHFFKEITCWRDTLILLSQDLFACQASCVYFSQNPITLRSPILLPLSESLDEPRDIYQMFKLNFSFGIFPFPPCLSSSFEEGMARLLASQKSIWGYESVLKDRTYILSGKKSENLSASLLIGDEAQIMLATRRQNLIKQCCLLRDVAMTDLSKEYPHPICSTNNFSSQKNVQLTSIKSIEATRLLGQEFLFRFCNSHSIREELLRLLLWILNHT